MNHDELFFRLLNLLPLLLLCMVLLYPTYFIAWSQTFLGKAVLVCLIPVFATLSLYLGLGYCIMLILFFQTVK